MHGPSRRRINPTTTSRMRFLWRTSRWIKTFTSVVQMEPFNSPYTALTTSQKEPTVVLASD
jgi:hypothetical protein